MLVAFVLGEILDEAACQVLSLLVPLSSICIGVTRIEDSGINAGQRSGNFEIEVRNFDELQQAMNVGGIDRIMLDNFNIEDTKKAVEMIGGRFETESSGGITFDTLRDYAECGVDFISVGALTHSVKSLDMSLKAC